MQRSGRPSTSGLDENVGKVNNLLDFDRRRLSVKLIKQNIEVLAILHEPVKRKRPEIAGSFTMMTTLQSWCEPGRFSPVHKAQENPEMSPF